MRSRSVSITGATGFLGWHVATAFQRDGWNVRAIVRPCSSKPLPDGVERVESPLAEAALRPAFAGSDVVVHAAAVIRSRSEEMLHAVNVDATRAVVEAANATGSRLVLISSQAAIGTGTALRPSLEDDAPQPLTAYGRSKLAAEACVRADARVPWTILRPSAIYGPRDRQFLPLFRLAARGRLLLAGDPATMFTLIEVTDATRAVVMAAKNMRAVANTFFIGHPEPQSAEDLLRELARVVGRAGTPRRLPAAMLRALALAGDVAWSLGFEPMLDTARLAELQAEGFVCAIDRARDELGFTAATPLPAGLASTFLWYRRQGWV